MTAGPRRLAVVALVVFTLVVVSVVPWRRGAIYAGGADAVVVAKALVALVALAAAAALFAAARMRGSTGARSLTLLVAIACVSALGALSTGDPDASLVLVVRLLIASATVVLVVRSVAPEVVITALLTAMGAVAVFTAVTGLLAGVTDGRLAGGLPEMAPNVLAGLAGPPVLGIAALFARRGIRAWSGLAFVVLVAIVLATGSRTSLLVVVVGVVLTLAHSRRLPASTVVATIAAVPVLAGIVLLTDTVGQAVSRGQNLQELSSFSSRTVAWDAVLATPFDTWAKWIGVGLAAKTVEVQERWRDSQVLDSSWVSIIAQAGIVGTVLLVVWVIGVVAASVRDRRLGGLTTPLLVLILIRSFTENGLVESSSTFVLFLAVSLVLEPASRFPDLSRPPGDYRLAEPLPRIAAPSLTRATKEHSAVSPAPATGRDG